MSTRMARLVVVVVFLGLIATVAWQLGVLEFGGTTASPSSPYPGVLLQRTYTVVAGDTVLGLAHHFGISEASLLHANHLTNPNRIFVGEEIVIPPSYHPKRTARLIRRVARHFSLDSNFALAIAWNESGFQENAVSATGAIGIMQIEPVTAVQLSSDLGRTINLAVESDNVTAGLYYLSYLVRYYAGNERSAAAAYYEGQGTLAHHGYVGYTSKYVTLVVALRNQFRHGEFRW